MTRLMWVVVCSIASVQIARADSATQNVLNETKPLLDAKNFVEACPRLELALKVDPSDQMLRGTLYGCYKGHATSLLEKNEDATKLCERVEKAAQGSASEAPKLAHQYCIKGHADALMDAGKFERACPRAEESLKLEASAKNKAFVAECYQRWSKLGQAWRWLVDAMTTVRATKEPGMEDTIKVLFAKLDPGPGRVVVQLPTRATVTVDGAPITEPGLAIAGAPAPKDAGNREGYPLDAKVKHVIRVTASGKPDFERTLEVTDNGKVETVIVEWPADKNEPTPSATNPAPTKSQRKMAGWITIGASAAIGAVGLYFGYDALQKQHDANDACPTHPVGCNPAARTLNDKADRSANVSNVMVGIGLAGAVVGTFLVLTAPKETRILPTAGPNGVGVVLTRGF